MPAPTGSSCKTILKLFVLLILPSILLLGASTDLSTPQPSTPNGPSAARPEFRWTAVPGAEFYVVRVWAQDIEVCPTGTGKSYGLHSPYVMFFSAAEMCDTTQCAFTFKANNFVESPITGRTLAAQPVGAQREATKKEENVKTLSTTPPVIERARRCNGTPYVWRWAVQAVAGLNSTAKIWEKKSLQSAQLSYTLQEGSQPAPPPAPSPKPHPVSFVNRSGMTLYIYFSVRGGVVQCKDFQNGGKLENGATTRQFTVPPRITGQFVFQKDDEPCNFDFQYTTRNVPGGNPSPETISIP